MSFHLRGRRSHTRANYRIAQNNKFEYTAPEKVVGEILKKLAFEIDFSFRPQYHFAAKDVEMGRWWDFIADFGLWGQWIRTKALEIDGKYHDTHIQQRKTEWRDRVLVNNGYLIIHVDAELTKTKALQEYLTNELRKALESKEPVVRIVG